MYDYIYFFKEHDDALFAKLLYKHLKESNQLDEVNFS
jgi:hypothetical protein